MNYWPTEDQTLLLRAGLLSEDDAIEAWHQVEPHLDLQRLDQASQRLLPLVYANLRRYAASAGRVADLREAYSTSWLWNQRLLGCARQVVDALGRAGIDSIALKGRALVMTSYRDVGARPMCDIDVLVPAGRVCVATTVLRRSGWLPGYDLTPAFMLVRHAVPFRRESAEECDLHWRIFEEAGAASLDDDWWAHATVVDVEGTRFRVLCPADQPLRVCVHGAKWTPLPAI